MKNKLMQAGLSGEHAEMTAEVLVWSDERGYHSHGSVRMEYYCERIAKGGINTSPNFSFRTTGPCTGIYEGDNGCGYVAATHAMEHAIDMAKQNGAAVIGIRNISHSGAIGYYTEMAAKQDLLAISFCQSDPMAVPWRHGAVFRDKPDLLCRAVGGWPHRCVRYGDDGTGVGQNPR